MWKWFAGSYILLLMLYPEGLYAWSFLAITAIGWFQDYYNRSVVDYYNMCEKHGINPLAEMLEEEKEEEAA